MDLTGLQPSETPLEIFRRFAPEAASTLDGDGSAELQARGVSLAAGSDGTKYAQKADVLLRGVEARVSYGQGLAAGIAELQARRLFLVRAMAPLVYAARGMADDIIIRSRRDWNSKLGEELDTIAKESRELQARARRVEEAHRLLASRLTLEEREGDQQVKHLLGVEIPAMEKQVEQASRAVLAVRRQRQDLVNLLDGMSKHGETILTRPGGVGSSLGEEQSASKEALDRGLGGDLGVEGGASTFDDAANPGQEEEHGKGDHDQAGYAAAAGELDWGGDGGGKGGDAWGAEGAAADSWEEGFGKEPAASAADPGGDAHASTDTP